MFYIFCAKILSLFWRSSLPVPCDVLQHIVHQQESSQRRKMKFGQGVAKQPEVLALCCDGQTQHLQSLHCWKIFVVCLRLPVGQLSGEDRRSQQVPGAGGLKGQNNNMLVLSHLALRSPVLGTADRAACKQRLEVLQKPLTMKFQLNIISEQVMSRRRCLIVL